MNPLSENQNTSKSASTHTRYVVLAALSLGFVLAYLPRAGLAPLASTIKKDLSFDDLQMGRILAVFFAGYFLFQIPGGLLGQKLGNRIALPLLHLLAAFANLLTAVAYSFGLIWISRLILGLAQAGMVPCTAQVIKNWVPESQRGIASSLMGSFMSVGSIIATGLTASLVVPFGWRFPLILFSIFSLCWVIFFFLFFRDQPEDHPHTNSEEVNLIGNHSKIIKNDTEEKAHTNKSTLIYQMISNRNIWLFCLQLAFRGFGYAFFITWFPSYLQNSSGASVQEAGLLAMLPLIGVVLGTLTGGKLIDLIYSRTGNKYFSRSLVGVFSHLICAICILGAAWAEPFSAVYLISCGTFLSGVGNPSTWVTAMDLGGKHTSVVIAVGNMMGSVGTYVSPIVVANLFTYIKEMNTPNWNLTLYLFAGIYLAATLCWSFINPNQSISD